MRRDRAISDPVALLIPTLPLVPATRTHLQAPNAPPASANASPRLEPRELFRLYEPLAVTVVDPSSGDVIAAAPALPPRAAAAAAALGMSPGTPMLKELAKRLMTAAWGPAAALAGDDDGALGGGGGAADADGEQGAAGGAPASSALSVSRRGPARLGAC